MQPRLRSKVFEKLHLAPRLKNRDFFLTLLPAVLWLLAVQSRSQLLTPHCDQAPQNCSPQTLFILDRLGFEMSYPNSDYYSYWTQNLSGVLLFGLPPIWNVALVHLGRLTPHLLRGSAWVNTGIDLTLAVQTTVWNGLATEVSHLLSQRPRPFVYTQLQEAKNSSNYTSFYSGHTSFSASAIFALIFILMSRQAPTGLLIGVNVMGQFLILATGMFRVLADRHFVTDVLVGAFAGGMIAFIVAYLHRPHHTIK